jgi:hypothetical protein
LKQTSDEPFLRVGLELLKNTRYLLPCHDLRNSLLMASPQDPFELADLAIEDMAKEKHECIERLVLRAR